ncbi:MAG: diacylglycerol/lipid kinase family protein [Patescibacteria group bacterium]
MYFYLYDSFLIEPKYRNLINQIETRLTDLGISGKAVRLTILKNATEVIKDNLKRGIQTVVAIGSDRLFTESAIALAGTEAVLGFIPIGPSELAEILGIPLADYACDVISGRRIEKIDLGKINNQYFLSSIQIDDSNINLRCDGSYQISPVSIKTVKIINLDWLNFSSPTSRINLQKKSSNPKDGLLEILSVKKPKITLPFFKKAERKDSLFYVKKVDIEANKEKEIFITVDNEKVFKTPAEVEVVPNCLKVIVGRDRLI